MKKSLANWFYYWIGIMFLTLARIKAFLQGYKTPKPFSINEYKKCVDYDLFVADRYIKHLSDYVKNDEESRLDNKRVLELGPGSDLGLGLYLLSKEAKEYVAVDVNNLVKDVPGEFYSTFFKHLNDKYDVDTKDLEKELERTTKGDNNKLDYICRKDFDIVDALGERKVDIVFSNAAFEHFDDIEQTIADVSNVCESGALFVVLVDLQTHSRWIREKDPNNIYRYSKGLYRMLTTSGAPNRVRPYKYKEALEKNGWEDVEIISNEHLENDRLDSVKKHLNKEFVADKNQMNELAVFICARKA